MVKWRKRCEIKQSSPELPGQFTPNLAQSIHVRKDLGAQLFTNKEHLNNQCYGVIMALHKYIY